MNFFNWMTPQRIYEELTGGPGSGMLSTAQGISHEQMGRELERAFRIQRLAKNVQGGWQGSAADGAYGAAQPLAAAAVDGNQHLYRAQDLLDRQNGSFGRAANSVVPMPAERPEAGMLDEALPWDTDTEKQVKAYQADAQHNIQVFEGYDNESVYNENMPRDYTITNHSGGTMSVTGGDTIDSDDYRRSGGESGGPGNYSAPGNGDPGGAGYPGGSTGGASSGGPLPGGSAGSQTSPNEYRPSPAPGGSPGGYPQSPAAHQPSTMPPGGFVPGPTGGYPGGSGGGPGSRGGSGPGGRGPGGGVAGGPGAGGRVPGPGGGAGALAAEEAAARRGAVGSGAAGGRGGMGPMGAPMGAGRGKGDDDEEHTRKVLIEPDPESTFGSDVMTAPQVIGDDAYEE